MLASIGNIVVRVNTSQNDEVVIFDSVLKTGKNYNENFRERNPVLAEVLEGIGNIPKGNYIVCNYNHFDEESPFRLSDNIYSIPVNEEIFGIVCGNGDLKPLCGNIFVKRVNKDTSISMPDELKKQYANQGVVLTNCEGYYKDQYVFWLPYSDYEIVYYWNGVERRFIKIHKTEVVGYLK